MKTDFISTIPVLPSQNIARDLDWYSRNFGFIKTFGDNRYAGMRLEGIEIHLQWHADTTEDPLLGGSVVRNIEPYFESLVIKGIIKCDKLIRNTAWGTHEFGLYDPNNNAIFIVEDIASSTEKTS
ncbi:glyoxalase/bleomycin resistance/extradiol dioxygenase family protein [Algoriphagus sp. D3-2-R+10]|uniref:glyoxalase/bleomycin resistance/extradiol dioxygenase family protein n=1 Tax=Algoriphagus aurantiacus TaxID=3103948 RepID=UPI002B381DBF|nr:glyoxalase/bleomycin resistance/extradiol dioxygenase family protein [Algoriphagus sp. D3-2-R+10]MEB2775696.1 glyoxalase/bleomycin resistance/extradiol dioxygenase family protein [Algoriphagus sp. D3-2-R+10]